MSHPDLTDEEVQAVKDALVNTAIELVDDHEDDAADLLKSAFLKLFGQEMEMPD